MSQTTYFLGLYEWDNFFFIFDILIPFSHNTDRDNDAFFFQIVDIELISIPDIGLIISGIFSIAYRKKIIDMPFEGF